MSRQIPDALQRESASPDAAAAPAAGGEAPSLPYSMAMVFNYHDTFSLPDFVRQCEIELPQKENLCAFLPPDHMIQARLAIREKVRQRLLTTVLWNAPSGADAADGCCRRSLRWRRATTQRSRMRSAG